MVASWLRTMLLLGAFIKASTTAGANLPSRILAKTGDIIPAETTPTFGSREHRPCTVHPGTIPLDTDGNPVAPKRVVPPSLTAQGRLRVNDKIEPPGEWRSTGRLTHLYKWMVDELPPPKKRVRPAHAA